MNPCIETGCDGLAKSHGLCHKHYMRQWRKQKAGVPEDAQRKASQRDIPWKPGNYIVTCAQLGGRLHEDFFKTLKRIAKRRDAEIVIIPQRAVGGAKGKRFPSEVVDSLLFSRRGLAPKLACHPELRSPPTAIQPLSGLGAIDGDVSIILGHPKTAMECIPTPVGERPKFLYSTGSCTLPDYPRTKAGYRGEFHHTISALIVEVGKDGRYFVRNLHWSEDLGGVHDLKTFYSPTGCRVSKPLAIVWGDIHVAQICEENAETCWGLGGILDTLQPKTQVFHDIFDMRARNPHETRDFLAKFSVFENGEESVEDELARVFEFLVSTHRPGGESVIVRSNHDDMLDRWINTADFREDPRNAKIFLQACLLKLDSLSEGALSLIMKDWGIDENGKFLFLGIDEAFEVAGVDLGQHGHVGSKGSRGNPRMFGRLGLKSITGHVHAPMIFNGAYVVGTSSKLSLNYTKGLSDWSHTHAILHPGGKRQLITLWDDHTWRIE